MPRQSKAPLRLEDLQGFRYLVHFRCLFDSLHCCAIQDDTAGNRRLFYDQYASLLLLYFFSPALDSLRGLQQASTLQKVQRHTGCCATSLGSLSEAAAVFDPQRLRPVIADLAEQAVPVVTGHEAEALRGLTAVDGSLLEALPRMAWALWQDEDHRAAKMHVHFAVLKAVPEDATVTPAACSEIDELTATLKPGRLYAIDRGYGSFRLFRAILDAESSFVGRVKENTAFEVLEEKPVSPQARAAGVIRDVVVKRLGTPHHKDELKRPVRLVWVSTGKTGADGQPEVLLLCTDRLELDAELVALAYKYRWWVELFFRWLKCILGLRHLLSNRSNGVSIQVYLALIASLLVSLWTGHKPSKRTFEMLSFFFSGWASPEELLQHIQNLHRRAKEDSS
jgi:Transposase DDE domain